MWNKCCCHKHHKKWCSKTVYTYKDGCIFHSNLCDDKHHRDSHCDCHKHKKHHYDCDWDCHKHKKHHYDCDCDCHKHKKHHYDCDWNCHKHNQHYYDCDWDCHKHKQYHHDFKDDCNQYEKHKKYDWFYNNLQCEKQICGHCLNDNCLCNKLIPGTKFKKVGLKSGTEFFKLCVKCYNAETGCVKFIKYRDGEEILIVDCHDIEYLICK